MMTSPIAGNQYFSKVAYLTEQIQKVNADSVSVKNLDADVARVSGLSVSGELYGGKKMYSVTAYAPLGFGPTGSYFLNKSTGLANQGTPGVSNTNVVTLPPGAVVTGVFLQDPAAVGTGATYSCGTQSVAVAPTTATNLMDTTGRTVVVAGALTANWIPVLLGAAGTTPGGVAVPALPTVTGIVVTVATAAITSSPGLRATVYYLL